MPKANCIICDSEFKYTITEGTPKKRIFVCSTRCNSQYYNDREYREIVMECIEKNDFHLIRTYSVQKLQKLGFSLSITEKLAN